jgi:sigma-B regulation protein RsbU (phosphoserine phosphatase)
LYVSTLSGAHVAYPGHSGYPPEYRPHERLWFTSIAEAGAPDIDAASDEDARYRPVWSGPTVDVRTGALVMTLSMGVFDEAGALAAVAAADVRLDGLLTGLPRLVEWSDEARSLVLYIAADGVADDENIAAAAERGGVNRADVVLIVAEQGDMASGPWDMPPGLRPLLLAEAEDQRQLAETMRAGGSKISTTRLLDGSESVLLAVTPFRPGTAAERSHLAIVVPTSSIEAPAERLSSQLAAQVFTQIATNGAVAVLAVALVIVAGFFASRSVTRPVRELVSTAERISAGDLGARADVDRGDELGTLARAFNEMVPKLRDRMRMQESLTLAMDVQRQLLPSGSPDVRGLDLHGESAYCDETGGDYYDFIALGEEGAGGERTTDGDASRGDDVAVVLGDVTGHGVAAALLMTTARALLRGALSRGGSLAGAISEVNDHLCRDASDGRFMTLCAVATDHGSRELRVVVAGHDAPILFDEATGSITEVLSEPGLPLGVIEGTPYSERRLPALTPSQILVIGTDGVWEAPNDAGEMFGKQRMIEVVEGCCGCTASEVCDRVLKAVSAFRGGAEQRDDITLIVMRGTENAAAEIPT